MEKKKVEFIESYIKVGNSDYIWNDNHGELIRCKDCKYGDWTHNMLKEDMILCYNGDTGIEDGYLHEPNWFCAEGERRTD